MGKFVEDVRSGCADRVNMVGRARFIRCFRINRWSKNLRYYHGRDCNEPEIISDP